MSFNKKFILRSGSFSSLEVLSNQILGLASFFILVRVMTKEEFGIWVLYISTTTFLEQARVGFLKNGFIKYLTGADDESAGEIFTASLLLNLISFLITSLICILFGYYIGPVAWKADILKPMFLLYIPYSFLLTFYLQFKMVEQAHMDFKGSFLTALFRRLFFIAAIIIFISFGYSFDLITLVMLNLVSIGLGVLAAYLLARNRFVSWGQLKKQWLVKLTSFGFYTFGTSIGATLIHNIDQFMLGTFSNKVYLALYNTAIRITNLIDIPTNAMSSIVYPKGVMLAKHDKRIELKEMYEQSLGIIFVFVLPIVLVILIIPEFFILIIAGKGYLDTVPYLRITILFSLFVPFIRQGGIVLDSMGMPKINFFLTLFSAITNVLFNLVFIKNFGPIGAAYGTLCAYAIMIIVNQVFLYRFLDVRLSEIMFYFFKYYQFGFKWLYKILKARFI